MYSMDWGGGGVIRKQKRLTVFIQCTVKKTDLIIFIQSHVNISTCLLDHRKSTLARGSRLDYTPLL